MGPLVRTVCTACLQSLEVDSGAEVEGRAVCPYCGARVEMSQFSPDASTGDDPSAPVSIHPDSVTPRDEPSGPQPTNRIARFVIREPLGEGGYGQVYRAYDPQLDRDVALKVLKPNRLGEKAMERFYREARAAARLDHPNIVGLHDAGCDLGRCWIAYQLVPGRTLSLIRDLDRPTLATSIRIVRDLALALEHAHGRGVFHRDLKPANVLVDDSGRARLTDFGLARRDDEDSDLTREGTVLGTPQYMSPEAAAGRAHEADARSDVYSLGVILYELLCGRRPSDVPSGAPLWRSTRVVTPPTPRSVDRAIPLALDRICMKALAFHPDDRYPTARALADALAAQVSARPPRDGRRRSVAVRGPAIGMVLASVACLALGMSLKVVPHEGPPPGVSPALGPAAPPRPAPIPVNLPAAPAPFPAPPEPATRPATTHVTLKPTPEPGAAPDLWSEPVVWIEKSADRKVHRKGCYVTRKIDPARLVDEGPARLAVANGFVPCKNCLKKLGLTLDAGKSAGSGPVAPD